MNLDKITTEALEAELERRRRLLQEASIYQLMNALVSRHADNWRSPIGPIGQVEIQMLTNYSPHGVETYEGPGWIIFVKDESLKGDSDDE